MPRRCVDTKTWMCLIGQFRCDVGLSCLKSFWKRQFSFMKGRILLKQRMWYWCHSQRNSRERWSKKYWNYGSIIDNFQELVTSFCHPITQPPTPFDRVLKLFQMELSCNFVMVPCDIQICSMEFLLMFRKGNFRQSVFLVVDRWIRVTEMMENKKRNFFGNQISPRNCPTMPPSSIVLTSSYLRLEARIMFQIEGNHLPTLLILLC